MVIQEREQHRLTAIDRRPVQGIPDPDLVGPISLEPPEPARRSWHQLVPQPPRPPARLWSDKPDLEEGGSRVGPNQAITTALTGAK